MTPPADIARALVDRLEGAETRSAAVLRAMAYRALTAAGVNVDRLRRDACLEQIAELQAKVGRAKAKRPFHELRLEAQRAKLKTFSHVPTLELVRQRGEVPTVESFEENGDQLRSERHRWMWPVDKIRHCIPAEHYAAADRLRWAHTARQGGSRIGDYGDGSGRSDPARRLPLTPEQEKAGRTWNAMWLRMNPAIRLIAWNFILEEPPRGWDRPMTAREFGEMYGRTSNDSRARGVTDGAVITACAILAELARGYSAWQAQSEQQRRKPPPLSERELAYIQGRRINGEKVRL
jgi:hypothetical protein